MVRESSELWSLIQDRSAQLEGWPDAGAEVERALGQMSTVDDLARAAADGSLDPEDRSLAVELLGRLGITEAAEVLTRLAANPEENPVVRGAAVLALGRLEFRESVPVLLDVLQSGATVSPLHGTSLARLAISALGDIDDPRANQALIDVARNRNEPEPLRIAALGAMTFMAGPDDEARFVQVALGLLDEGPAELRGEAVYALGSLGRTHDVIDALLRVVDDESPLAEGGSVGDQARTAIDDVRSRISN